VKDPDFIAIPYQVFIDKHLRPTSKLVYGRLRLYAGKDGRCYPKHQTLASELGITDRQIRTVLQELRIRGWIDWIKARTSCLYTVHSDRKKTSAAEPAAPRETGRKLPA
jgi:hypothetical protein